MVQAAHVGGGAVDFRMPLSLVLARPGSRGGSNVSLRFCSSPVEAAQYVVWDEIVFAIANYVVSSQAGSLGLGAHSERAPRTLDVGREWVVVDVVDGRPSLACAMQSCKHSAVLAAFPEATRTYVHPARAPAQCFSNPNSRRRPVLFPSLLLTTYKPAVPTQ